MLPAAVKNKIEKIWLDVIAGGVSQPTEVIDQLTYLMFTREEQIKFVQVINSIKSNALVA